ncbi:UDP-3-O-acyl-N-acetylglucosamine deacetylase [Crateriforma spongiae]|uniref:UDP-3-O-acyl-N-acetylglucosamine deacetylase n=1 Tax=Crateriforma spongiae TaxID=2724528 RepID=UPI00144790BB|nr:UDP-3-O-acyl-N-acetylglucosamine deacetylase [Crateriforma spongiae]
MDGSRTPTTASGKPTGRNQHTIASPCSVRGRGYWSGQDVHLTISPAPVNTGVRLVRSDLPDQPSLLATTDRSDAISFRTLLRDGDASFAMVEHLMAALAGLEIDNCVVEIDGEEMPGLDGSSLAFVEALQSAGLVIQADTRMQLVIHQPLRLRHNDGWIEATPSISGETYFEYQLNYGDDSPVPAGNFGIEMTPHRFVRQVAPARTFVTKEQADALHASGVASHVTHHDLLVFDDDGPIDNPLRYRNECSRHKTLDMIGDLALVPCDLIGRFISHRGGHILNGMLAKRLSEMLTQQRAGEQTRRKVA